MNLAEKQYILRRFSGLGSANPCISASSKGSFTRAIFNAIFVALLFQLLLLV